MLLVQNINLTDLLFILPQFLNAEDVKFVSVDMRKEAVRLSDGLALRCASAVSHQIHTVPCTRHTDRQVTLTQQFGFTRN